MLDTISKNRPMQKGAGAVPLILPLSGSNEEVLEIFDKCDGLLMTGGHDISPSLYHEPKRETCGIVCSDRDRIEQALYNNALSLHKPVLGICRGIQLINVLQGGTLYQDLPAEYACRDEHHMDPPYTNVAHDVRIRKESPLYDLLGTERLSVNSCHHQGIRILGKHLEIMAESNDGLTEAVRHTKQVFVWAVQWHPEFDFHSNPASRKIFEAFIKACENMN